MTRVKSTGPGRSAKGKLARSSSVTGAGGGTLLLSVLQGRTEAWAKALVYLAPSLGLAMATGLAWTLEQIDEYLLERKNQAKYLFVTKEARKVLDDERSSPEAKENARRLLDEADGYRLGVAREKLTRS